jgi:hypothetical protein
VSDTDPPNPLVTRLRGHAEWLHENHGHRPSGRNPIGDDCSDAADELERLAAAVPLLEDPQPTFNEDSLRAAIVSVWGEYGAHILVFDHMLALARSATKEP